MDNEDEIRLEIDRAEELVRTKALDRVRAIITHLEQAISLDVPVLPAADVVGVTQTQWPAYAQGWGAARDACLNTLAEVRKVGDRYESAIKAMGVEL